MVKADKEKLDSLRKELDRAESRIDAARDILMTTEADPETVDALLDALGLDRFGHRTRE